MERQLGEGRECGRSELEKFKATDLSEPADDVKPVDPEGPWHNALGRPTPPGSTQPGPENQLLGETLQAAKKKKKRRIIRE